MTKKKELNLSESSEMKDKESESAFSKADVSKTMNER